MKKLIIALMMCLVSSFFMSCKHNINEDLSTSNMKKLLEKDTLYEDVFDIVKNVNDTLLKNQILYTKYSDITYEEIYDYMKEISDTSSEFNDMIKEKEKTILSKYKPSIDIKLKKYKDTYAGNFFDIEFVGTDITYYEYISGVDDAYFKFKITPKQNIKLNGCSFRYELYDRVHNTIIEDGKCKTLENITKPYVGYWEIPYSYKDEFGYETSKKIKEKYSFKFIPLSVNVDGKIYEVDTDSLLFGYKALLYIKYNIDYTGYNILKELFNKDDKKDLYVYYLSICEEENNKEYLKILDIEKERELLNPKIYNLLKIIK